MTLRSLTVEIFGFVFINLHQNCFIFSQNFFFICDLLDIFEYFDGFGFTCLDFPAEVFKISGSGFHQLLLCIKYFFACFKQEGSITSNCSYRNAETACIGGYMCYVFEYVSKRPNAKCFSQSVVK